jgi:hypothetical protein
MSEKIQEYPIENLGNRNAFNNYFKSLNEFSSVVSNKVRAGETNLEKIKSSPLNFVRQLIGRDKADKLTSAELDVFVEEAQRIILENEKIRKGSVKNLEEQAILAGFVDEGYYDNNGNKVLKGDIEAYQRHINGDVEEDED